ncbi:MAG TPA: LytR C-terminal domain-containing protein, partial [Microthrixaceae bacterium]|nr:LytR C-terminal domain-containing protein [Microthrixaceae bacterium]
MTTSQRPRNPRQATPPNGPNPLMSGLILIAVGVVLAVILLVKAGGAGFDSNSADVKIGKGEEKVTTTTEAPTTTLAEQAPQTVQVVAANGSGASGMAAKAAAILAQSGYTQVVSTNSVQPVTASSIMYATGYDANARAIAKALGLPETAVQPLAAGAQVAKDQPATSGVIIMIGPDLT